MIATCGASRPHRPGFAGLPAHFRTRPAPPHAALRPPTPPPAASAGPARTLALTDLEPGKEYDGVVVSIRDFGAFVNIGCQTDGLLHISQVRRASQQAELHASGSAEVVTTTPCIGITHIDGSAW